MNKKFLLAGLVAATGFVLLTAFGGKTLEQQKQEIAAAVTARLDEFRAQKEEECTMKVNAESQTRFQAYLASKPAEPAPAKTAPKKSKPKPVAKDPLPQTAPAPTNPKQEKMQNVPNTEEKKEKMMETPNTDKKKQKMQSGGGGN